MSCRKTTLVLHEINASTERMTELTNCGTWDKKIKKKSWNTETLYDPNRECKRYEGYTAEYSTEPEHSGASAISRYFDIPWIPLQRHYQLPWLPLGQPPSFPAPQTSIYHEFFVEFRLAFSSNYGSGFLSTKISLQWSLVELYGLTLILSQERNRVVVEVKK